jgi:hypothetical protein
MHASHSVADDLAADLGNMKLEALPPPPPTLPAAPTKPGALPADAYRQQILDQVARDRVTIIHGETG